MSDQAWVQYLTAKTSDMQTLFRSENRRIQPEEVYLAGGIEREKDVRSRGRLTLWFVYDVILSEFRTSICVIIYICCFRFWYLCHNCWSWSVKSDFHLVVGTEIIRDRERWTYNNSITRSLKPGQSYVLSKMSFVTVGGFVYFWCVVPPFDLFWAPFLI